MSFDLNSLTLQDTTILHLEHPVTGLPLLAAGDETKPVQVVIYGRTSKQYRNWLNAANRSKLDNKKKRQSLAADEADTVEFLVAVTKEVRNLSIGKDEINTPEMVKAMYANQAWSWIADQVAASLSEVDGFLQK